MYNHTELLILATEPALSQMEVGVSLRRGPLGEGKRIGGEGEDDRGCRGVKGKYVWSIVEALSTEFNCVYLIRWAVRPSRALFLLPYHTMLLFVKQFRAGSLFDVFHYNMRWASQENINISISQ